MWDVRKLISLLEFRKYHSKKAKKDPTVEKFAYIFLNQHTIIHLANEDILYTNHQLSL